MQIDTFIVIKVMFSFTTNKNTYLIRLDLVGTIVAVTQKMGLKMKKGEVRRIETPQDAAMTDLSNVP